MSDGVVFYQSPSEQLDYSIDWAAVLKSDESIVSSAWTITWDGEGDPDIEVVVDLQSSAITTIWLTGGTLGARYRAANLITTDSSPARSIERSFALILQKR